jgi:Xaa-Pro aminopeptidase
MELMKREMLGFKGLSFDTISSTGANAGESEFLVGFDVLAVIHYKAPSEGSAMIDIDQVYLCDSGAQYLDGMSPLSLQGSF